MHSRSFTITFLALALLQGCRDTTTPSVATAPDFKFIDSYLAKMTQEYNSFSRFDEETQRFQAQLALALSRKDRRAPGRIVYLTVREGLEGHGSIPEMSVLGRACHALFADNVPLTIKYPYHGVYTEGDIYFWWERHKGEYEAFPPYDSWRQSEHVKKTVIPMYESLAKKKPAA